MLNINCLNNFARYVDEFKTQYNINNDIIFISETVNNTQ